MSTTSDIPVVVSMRTFAGPFGDFHRGQKVRANDPTVVAYPEFFTTLDIPENEWKTDFDVHIDMLTEKEAEQRQRAQEEARRIFEAQAAQNVVKIPAPELVRCVADHTAMLNGRPCTVKRNSVVTADHELVSQNEGLWQPV